MARQWAVRKAWLFQAGDYPDKGFAAQPDDLDRIIAGTRAAQTAPHLDVEHYPTEGVLDFGGVVPSTLRRITGQPPGGTLGEWIVGDVMIDADVDRQLRARGLSVTLDRDLTHIAKVAITQTPRVAGAQFSAAEGTGPGLGGGYLMPEDSTAPLEEPTQIVAPPDAPVPKRGLLARLFRSGDPSEGDEVIGRITVEEVEEAIRRAAADAAAEATETVRAEMSVKLAEAEAKANAAQATARSQELVAFSTELLAAGVPPHLIEALAPFAVGLDNATIALSDGEPTPHTFAEAARHVLDAMRGTVPMARILPTDDGRDMTRDEQVLHRARTLAAEGGLDIRRAIDAANKEISNA